MKFKKPSSAFVQALIIGMLCIAVWLSLSRSDPAAEAKSVAYSELVSMAKTGALKSVHLNEYNVLGTSTKGELFTASLPLNDPFLVSDLLKVKGLEVVSEPRTPPSPLMGFLVTWGPILLLIGVWLYMQKAAQGGGGARAGGLFSFGKSKARRIEGHETKVTFADVAGCDEAKEEVQEIVDFLKAPQKFEKLGGKIPRGVLLGGPPGTGKTLLAKAIAGEANVPFFSISGSDFVEMFVGVGAARVRDLFQQAKESAPCILFIDEIDAVGRRRGTGVGGGNDEREQTLNQMLVEMDGFESGLGVIVIAATNRPDILDPALLRPGRFDRQVTVGLPDVRGREQILNVHLRKVPVGADVKAAVIARGTPGFSGAELSNLVNEAALIAARSNQNTISMGHFEKAKDKVLMGPERRSMQLSEKERSDTAYHEAGHAIVAKLLEHTDPVHKVSIVPRGRALGVTVQLPTEDRYSMGKKRILDTIAVLFGGRVAEELFTADVTTGASNDYERATRLARNMVMRWGMSDVIGPMVVGDADGALFSGHGAGASSEATSPETLQRVDAEVRKILEGQYQRAKSLLERHADKMEVMRNALMEWETLDAEQVEDIMAGKPPRAPAPAVPPAPQGSATTGSNDAALSPSGGAAPDELTRPA